MSDQAFDRRSHGTEPRSGRQVKGERRVITMVFYDVTGSTSMAEQARNQTRLISDENLKRRFLNLHEVHLLMENRGNNLA